MIEIGRPLSCERDAVSSLWEQVFQDSPEDIAFFLDRFFEYAVVLRVDNTLASMLFLIPCELVTGKERLSIGYIYAGATHPTYRANGYYRLLLETAERQATICDMAALFLQPANEQLFQTYHRMGFCVSLKSTSRDCSLNSFSQRCKRITPKQYKTIRSLRLQKNDRPFVDWPLSFVETACRFAHPVQLDDETVALLDIETTNERCFEHLGALNKAEITVGLMKPLLLSSFDESADIYMGYGMD